jgi:purine/pyrimidine-nucleoside phosphorylase
MSDLKFENVTAVAKGSVYFGGKVISHTILFQDGSKKTLGMIFPGEFRFETGAAEKMEITAGNSFVKVAGDAEWREYPADTYFTVPGNSHFEIAVKDGVVQYICSYE